MSVILTLCLIVGVLVLLVPLLIIASRALRRAGRKIDQIIEEECESRVDGNRRRNGDDASGRGSIHQE